MRLKKLLDIIAKLEGSVALPSIRYNEKVLKGNVMFKSRKIFAWFIVCLVVSVLYGCVEQTKTRPYGLEGKSHAAIVPVPRENWWDIRHEQVLKQVKKGNVDMLFIGDSITHGWEHNGRKFWDKYYAPRNAVNMGFNGDQTQHVLWRLDHGEIDGISPKLAVLMIGTNNSNGNDYTSEQIADGIKAICWKIRQKLPRTKILILAIFPRGSGPSLQREKNAQASELASQIADGKTIHYLNINETFLEDDGTLPKDIMPDLLHPNGKGYKIWAETIEPKIAELMNDAD